MNASFTTAPSLKDVPFTGAPAPALVLRDIDFSSGDRLFHTRGGAEPPNLSSLDEIQDGKEMRLVNTPLTHQRIRPVLGVGKGLLGCLETDQHIVNLFAGDLDNH